MPKSPFEGQRRPPCEPKIETAINGACWIQAGNAESPCGKAAFDWEGRCYVPSFNTLRQPTSGSEN
jgi:hypothetical protein